MSISGMMEWNDPASVGALPGLGHSSTEGTACPAYLQKPDFFPRSSSAVTAGFGSEPSNRPGTADSGTLSVARRWRTGGPTNSWSATSPVDSTLTTYAGLSPASTPDTLNPCLPERTWSLGEPPARPRRMHEKLIAFVGTGLTWRTRTSRKRASDTVGNAETRLAHDTSKCISGNRCGKGSLAAFAEGDEYLG